jgi:hypothetical protein
MVASTWKWIKSKRDLLIIILILLIGYIVLRPSRSQVDDLQMIVANGQPTVLDFYSDF